MINFKYEDENSLIESIQSIMPQFLQNEKRTILIVDDEENNLQFLNRTLRSQYKILTARNGVEAINVVESHKNISLIVSDQKMPDMTGTEFLKIISKNTPEIIKILLTGYSDTETIIESINDCHLYQYLLKPVDPEELKVVVDKGIQQYDLSDNRIEHTKALKELFYKTIKSISSALDTKDPYTHGHSERVTIYSLIIASKLNFSTKQLEELEIAGLLHDIGKIGIPQNILCKPGKLTDEEFNIMKIHPTRGEQMISKIEKLKDVATWLKYHHERWDGRGYPDGLKEEQIPLFSRIIALADTYDAMTSTRSYRKALEHEIAIEEIKKYSGSQFDPELAEILIKYSHEFKEAQENPEKFYIKYSSLNKN